MCDVNNVKTLGVGSFGEAENDDCPKRLFRVVPGHSLEHALMHSSQLMSCVRKLTCDDGTQKNSDVVCAVHYLSGMAGALLEDATEAVREASSQ